jgi:hypothetical protein
MSKQRQRSLDALDVASQEEERLWDLVVDRGPGRPGHDTRLWQQWLDAVQTSADAAEALASLSAPP